ncbi:cell envelope integrity protein CreD [Ramlibacter humi]|uniref:Cell envelope integrity protein CreD n=1 Tax=Ramlibacter humi TaxID=2530451 RepID=A0A4Z0BV44_9BURK|nr:cell envelope integrity protein CreD [Ramlibacter humi]TFZ01895.1 cell envelope integrity protein CreD [Ramlibacter humi]
MKNLFGQSMLGKGLLLVLLLVLLCLPLAQIGGLVGDRGVAQVQAERELAQTHAGHQQLAGPVLVVPYVERWTEAQLDANGKVSGRVPQSISGVHLVFPEKLDVEGALAPEERYRGIFTVLFYNWNARLTGGFAGSGPASIPRTRKDSVIEADAPMLAVGVTDPRGIQGLPTLRLAGEEARLQARVPGVSERSVLASGVHAPLAGAALQAWQRGAPIPFELKLSLLGQQRLSIVPLGEDTRARMASPWPHPSFGGDFLPAHREVTGGGFRAEWAVTSLVTPARSQMQANVTNPGSATESMQTFDVALAQPVSPYSLTHRAIHYGVLFIGLVLMAAFMFELFLRLRLHAIQYGLVGMSIALFFLLLLAGSEKVAFGIAYAAAAAGSVALLAAYFAGALRSAWRGLALGAYVGLLYAALYGLLLSEDNALLLGSLLAFAMLSVLMLATRKVDWYALTARPEGAPASA